MKVEITLDGKTSEVDVNPALDSFTLKESIRLEEALGEELFDRIMGSAEGGKVEIPAKPKIIQAILWSKLASQFPGLKIDDFDIDLGEVALETADNVVIPMTLPDGTELEGEVATGTGGKG